MEFVVRHGRKTLGTVDTNIWTAIKVLPIGHHLPNFGNLGVAVSAHFL